MSDDRMPSRARDAAGHFECKKDGLRQTQDGLWKLTLTVVDLPPWVMAARMGTRLMTALVEIGDDEEPVPHAAPRSGVEQTPSSRTVDTEVTPSPPLVRPNETVKALSAGAAMGSGAGRSTAGKERYQQSDEMQRAVVRASLLCKEPTFQRWFAAGPGNFDLSHVGGDRREEATAYWLKQHLSVKSRSEIAGNEAAFRRFLALETEYKLFTGQMAEQR